MDISSLISAILHDPRQSKRARVERGEALTKSPELQSLLEWKAEREGAALTLGPLHRQDAYNGSANGDVADDGKYDRIVMEAYVNRPNEAAVEHDFVKGETQRKVVRQLSCNLKIPYNALRAYCEIEVRHKLLAAHKRWRARRGKGFPANVGLDL